MVNLTRIYTRTGDDGTTALGDMSRVGKNDLRLKAYADVDEANSSIGVVLALGSPSESIAELLRKIQNDLFDVGADLCTPVVENPEYPPLRVLPEYVERLEAACDEYNETLEPLRSFILPGGTPAAALLHVLPEYVERLEAACDEYNETLEPLRSFILPGGTPAAALLHVARTVVRRAERSTWAAIEAHPETTSDLTAQYLNRLSDLLFILGRVANVGVGDVLWVPGGER